MQGQDLASGNLTAPVLFALQSNCGSELLDLIDSEFVEEGDLQRAIELVKTGGGIAAAKQLACEEADKVCSIFILPVFYAQSPNSALHMHEACSTDL